VTGHAREITDIMAAYPGDSDRIRVVTVTGRSIQMRQLTALVLRPNAPSPVTVVKAKKCAVAYGSREREEGVP
jgi:hypothetical protein